MPIFSKAFAKYFLKYSKLVDCSISDNYSDALSISSRLEEVTRVSNKEATFCSSTLLYPISVCSSA